MAEFCVKCWQELNGSKPRPRWTYQLGEDFCEGCGEWRTDIVYGLHAGPVQMAVQYIKIKAGE